MTEKEFLEQVWRPFDFILINGGIKGRLVNVCFPTRSVRITMPHGQPEWFRCELIEDHCPINGEPTDAATIESLNMKLSQAELQIDTLLAVKAQMEVELRDRREPPSLDRILTNTNVIINTLGEKKKRIEKLEECINNVKEALTGLFNTYGEHVEEPMQAVQELP